MEAPLPSFSGSVPENYDRYLGPYLFEPYALDLAARLPSGVQRALELACGTGRVTRHLRQTLPAGAELVATDLNPDMVARARTLLPDLAVTWQTADAQHLPFADAWFDLVVCQFGVMFMPDKGRAYGEAFRVLRPGGTLLFNAWDSLDANPMATATQGVFARFFPENPPQFFHIPHAYYDPIAIRTALGEAGFVDVRVELVEKEGRSPSAADVAKGYVEGTPVSAILRERNPALLEPIREAVAHALAERFGEAPCAGPIRAWVAQARKPL
jgi:SAM-dependent methyltransferase